MHFLHHLQKVWILFKFGYLKKSKRLDFIRHSHASMLVDMGVAPLEIAERLGHEKVETTLNTYSHLYPSTQSKLAGLLDKKHEEEEE